MTLLIQSLHILLICAYVVAPAVALAVDIHYLRLRGRKAPSPQFVATVCTGIALGTGIAVGFKFLTGARANVGQAVIASYFAGSLIFLLKGFDRLLRRGLVMAVLRRRWLLLPASLARIAILFSIGLPFMMATAFTYRLKVMTPDDPTTRFGVDYEKVSFDSSDGTQLAGWWVPAASRGHKRVARSTIVICHGTGIGKISALPLLASFSPNGFNVLMFDFRAHGASGGQLMSFGDNERRDVLGAVTWLQRTHPTQAQNIFGVGIDTGGAALIGAAADRGAAGQAIKAIAVIGGFDNFSALAGNYAHDRFFPPFNKVLATVGLAMANVQSGADLTDFSPGREIQSLWPRPVFIISGSSEPDFPMEMGRDLYESADQPKMSRWVEGANTADLLGDRDTCDAVRKFFQSAQPNPVI